MKIVKFRAWNRRKKKWFYFELQELQYDMCDWGIFDHWTQFTGKKDKNSTEIYEGDILKKQKRGYGKKSGHSLHVVEWRETEMLIGYFLPKGDIEVVGNIYEHPELMEKA